MDEGMFTATCYTDCYTTYDAGGGAADELGSAQFGGALGGRFHGVHERAAETGVFEDLQTGDGGATGACHHAREIAGTLRAVLQKGQATLNGGNGQFHGRVAGKARFDAAHDQSFDELENVSGTAARKAGNRIHLRFGNAYGAATGGKNGFNSFEGGFVGAIGGNGDRTLTYREGQIGHGAHHAGGKAERGLEALAGNARHDGNEQGVASAFGDVGAERRSHGTKNLGLDAQQHNVGLGESLGNGRRPRGSGIGEACRYGIAWFVKGDFFRCVGATQQAAQNGSAHVTGAYEKDMVRLGHDRLLVAKER